MNGSLGRCPSYTTSDALICELWAQGAGRQQGWAAPAGVAQRTGASGPTQDIECSHSRIIESRYCLDGQTGGHRFRARSRSNGDHRAHQEVQPPDHREAGAHLHKTVKMCNIIVWEGILHAWDKVHGQDSVGGQTAIHVTKRDASRGSEVER